MEVEGEPSGPPPNVTVSAESHMEKFNALARVADILFKVGSPGPAVNSYPTATRESARIAARKEKEMKDRKALTPSRANKFQRPPDLLSEAQAAVGAERNADLDAQFAAVEEAAAPGATAAAGPSTAGLASVTDRSAEQKEKNRLKRRREERSAEQKVKEKNRLKELKRRRKESGVGA
jgi:hypothetical protein